MAHFFSLLRKWLVIVAVIVGTGFVLFRGIQFRLQRDVLPMGTTVGDVNVEGLTIDQAKELVEEEYLRPIYLYHMEDHVELQPKDVGFVLDINGMYDQLEKELGESNQWTQFASFVIKRPIEVINIPLQAKHDQEGLSAMIESVAAFLDQPAQGPHMLATRKELQIGREGYVTDVDTSVKEVSKALYRLDDRNLQLTIVQEPIPERNLDLLMEAIEGELQGFDGMGSIFIMDLSTGEELAINADVAMSGLSLLKIAIFVEAYRAIDGPLNDYQQELFLDTATRSSNFGANLLLHEVAGEENTYRGADILTESMNSLGLANTFMAVPYDASPPAHRKTTAVTQANSRTDITTEPDPTMQSTAEEIGTLLSMIYYCSKGGGTLLALYGDKITPSECQETIDLMILNEEGNLIRFGVPQGTPVSHKHGWAQATHADAGIVFTPGGDFVIVEYLNQAGDWLLAEESFPILREIARATYNFFNMEEPYLSDALAERGFIDANNPFSEGQGDSQDRQIEDAEGDESQSNDEDPRNPEAQEEDGT